MSERMCSACKAGYPERGAYCSKCQDVMSAFLAELLGLGGFSYDDSFVCVEYDQVIEIMSKLESIPAMRADKITLEFSMDRFISDKWKYLNGYDRRLNAILDNLRQGRQS